MKKKILLMVLLLLVLLPVYFILKIILDQKKMGPSSNMRLDATAFLPHGLTANFTCRYNSR